MGYHLLSTWRRHQVLRCGYELSGNTQLGETGTAISEGTQQYLSRTSGSITTYHMAGSTRYRNSDGTGGQTTSNSYTWQGSTMQAESVTATLPTVTTAQNGPNSADSSVTFNDSYGRPVWSKDADGFISFVEYDAATGAVVKTITDVDTDLTSDFTNLPSGWSNSNGLHLKTTMEVDSLGRTTKVTAPNGNVSYTVYLDANHEVRSYAGWDSTTNLPTGPTMLSREDRAGGYTESLTMSATPNLTSSKPNGTESISSIQTLSRTYTNIGGQVTHSDVYFNLSGLTYSTSMTLGTENTHFYRTSFSYDKMGRQDRVQSPTGTITRHFFDSLGRSVSTWIGLDDTPTSGLWSPTNTAGTDLVKLSENEYDSGGIGDGLLTKTTVIPGGSEANRVTQFYHDWRQRTVATKSGVETTESTSVNRPISYVELDNLGQVIASEMYDGDGVTITTTNGVPDKPSSSLRRSRSETNFDEQGRAYQSKTFSVDPTNGNISTNALTSNSWFDHRGQIIKQSSPGGLVMKYQYDGAGRTTKSFVTDGGGDSAWSDADDITGDVVLEQTEPTYDVSGNVLMTTQRRRNHDETGTGELGTATTGVKARVSYATTYYDKGDRATASVDVGTNGGSSYTRPSTVPSRSDTVLVTDVNYNAAGWVETVTDPRGIVGKTYQDNLGRNTKTIENYVNGTPSDTDDKTTEFTYDGSGHMLTLKASLTSGYQETKWVYGTSTGTSDGVNSNDILKEMRYPDKSTGAASSSEKEIYTVNQLGQQKTKTDRNGSVHTYSFDILGRTTADAVTTLGSGVDGAIRRIEMAYDGQGNAYLLTSYDAATAGNIVNQVQQVYNGLGQLITEYQSHSGAVSTSTTPKVQYAYSEMASGANHSRPTSTTYPNGTVVALNYAIGTDNNISRLTSLSSGGNTLEAFDYLGLGTVVRRAHSQPGVDLTYIKQGAESDGDAGDKYTGLDRFDRIVDQRWIKTSDGSHTDRFKYGYDRDSNRFYRDSLLNDNFDELYHANGASAGYDSLNQLIDVRRGALSDTNSDNIPDTVATASRSQGWAFDALGNWNTLTTDGSGVNRTHNKQNQVTAVGANNLTFDANGNLKSDELGTTYNYDAWNRLVSADPTGPTSITYSHDALNRRVIENPGTATDLYYSAAWQILEERVAGNAKIQYIWSPVYIDAMILRDRDADGNGSLEERLYAQQDANFNVTAIISTSGAVQERFALDAYGQVTFLNASWTTQSSSASDWVYLHQGGRFQAVGGTYSFRNRDYSIALGRWVQLDPLGLKVDANPYRYALNSPHFNNDPFGLDVTVFWIEGATGPLQKRGGLEVNVINPLKMVFMKEPKVKWQGFQAGIGINMGGKTHGIAEKIKKCPDKTVLIGYSWGGYMAIQVLEWAYKNLAGFPETNPPTFKVNLVYTIDPVIGTPGPKYDPRPYPDAMIPDNFDEWHNWFQQVDDRESLPPLKVWGRSLNDPKINNKEYGVDDFGTPKAAHTEIVTKKAIRDEIEGGIRKLI